MSRDPFDVIIAGGGFAGLVQARHLLLNIPGIRVAVIDPRGEAEILEKEKVGEALNEYASGFLAHDLKLHEYLIEEHAPKHGQRFHWPRSLTQTESMDDYITTGTMSPQPTVFHLRRGRFERDLLAMNRHLGMTHVQAKITNVELTDGDELIPVTVRDGDGTQVLYARHFVDAAGRAFLVAKQTDNLVRDPAKLSGQSTGASWLRVSHVDRSILEQLDRSGSGVSYYYSTNQFLGHGHWIWVLPVDRTDNTVSIGVTFHHNAISAGQLNTEDKLRSFLAANHGVLSRLVESGVACDFAFRNKLSYASKTLYSKDNWYVLGDSAFFGDPLYALGTSTASVAAESITAIVKAKLSGDKDAEKRREAYNDFGLAYQSLLLKLYRHHDVMLGDPSVMSWRLYWENMWWFGALLPLTQSKWHLSVPFARFWSRVSHSFFPAVLEKLAAVARQGKNIGFLEFGRADQLIGGYRITREAEPIHQNDLHGKANTLYPARRINVFRWVAHTTLFALVFFTKFTWRSRGVLGVLDPRNIYIWGRGTCAWLGISTLSVIAGAVQRLSRWRRKATPKLAKSHSAPRALVPWDASTRNRAASRSSDRGGDEPRRIPSIPSTAPGRESCP